jgi:hypothetical protein
VTWFLSDDLPEIPADILERLERNYEHGDPGDYEDAERERSSVRRLVAINQKLQWQIVDLQTDLHTANTNVGYLKGQVRDLVARLGRLGYVASHKPPDRK